MSRDWSGQWPQKSWNWNADNWDTTNGNWTVKEVQPPAVRIPPEWKTTQTMFDEETLYGHKCFKTIQPTAWSRRKGFVGLNPLTIPIGLLTRHGASEYGLRLLSEGRFMGIVTTRSIAESVFGAQILKSFRESGIDIDGLCEHLHRSKDPNATIPNKSEDPVTFMQPLVAMLTAKAKEQSPAKQDTAAIRELQAVQKKLRETEAKLRLSQQSAGSHPSTPSPSPLNAAVVGSAVDEDVIENFEDIPIEEEKGSQKAKRPLPTNTTKRSSPPSSAVLGASPKAKQRRLTQWVQNQNKNTTETPKEETLTVEEVLNPSTPVMRDNQPSGSSPGDIKKWMESFDIETQQAAKKILQMLSEHKFHKEKLQNAAAQYGLNVQQSLKMTPKSLQQVDLHCCCNDLLTSCLLQGV